MTLIKDHTFLAYERVLIIIRGSIKFLWRRLWVSNLLLISLYLHYKKMDYYFTFNEFFFFGHNESVDRKYLKTNYRIIMWLKLNVNSPNVIINKKSAIIYKVLHVTCQSVKLSIEKVFNYFIGLSENCWSIFFFEG